MDPYLPADLPYVVDRNPRASLLVGLMSILKVEQSFLRSRSMIIIYMAASIIGGTATAALVGQHSLLLGLLAAPLGGSLSALAAIPLALGGLPKRQSVPSDVVWC